MDIGCYPVTTSRLLFGEEPKRVVALIELDPDYGTDRLASAILDFPTGQSIFTCSTQLVPYQRVQMFRTRGHIEIEIPFNAPPDRPCRIFVDGREELIDTCDQYTIQGDLFSRAILEGGEVPVPLEDSVRNMAVLDALFRSAETGSWQKPEA